MDFDELLATILQLLQQEKRLSYRALKRRFALDDEYLEDVKAELIQAKQVARDEAGAVLVWTGSDDTPPSPPPQPAPEEAQPSRVAPSRSFLPRLTPNAASSPCCFATWSTRPPSQANSTRKTCMRSCRPIKTPAPR